MVPVNNESSVVVCTCADNSTQPPLVIYKGKGLYRDRFIKVDDQNVKPSHSNKGCTADKLAIKWLLQAFDVATDEHARGQPRFLPMDNHRMH